MHARLRFVQQIVSFFVFSKDFHWLTVSVQEAGLAETAKYCLEVGTWNGISSQGRMSLDWCVCFSVSSCNGLCETDVYIYCGG